MKFRAWDLKEKKYIDSCDIFISGEGNIYVYESLNLPSNYDFIIELQTPYKDRKGNKIYENDILLFSGLYYQVHFDDHSFTAKCPNYNRYHWPKFENFKMNCLCSELAGNVHENIDLLQ
jgi:hypothetical protein